MSAIPGFNFCLNMAKLFAVLISSLRLFQSRLPLNFNEFVANICDLASGSLQSILILKSYPTTFLGKRFHSNWALTQGLFGQGKNVLFT